MLREWGVSALNDRNLKGARAGARAGVRAGARKGARAGARADEARARMMISACG